MLLRLQRHGRIHAPGAQGRTGARLDTVYPVCETDRSGLYGSDLRVLLLRSTSFRGRAVSFGIVTN